MAQRKSRTQSQLFATLVLPLVIGLAMYLLLNLLIDRSVITDEALLRYLTGHPISRITTFMFCVGVGALLMIANNVFDQFCNCDRISLGEIDSSEDAEPTSKSLSDRTADLVHRLHEFRTPIQRQYLWQRLSAALGFIERTDSSSGIEDELKYLADLDRDKQQRRYSLVRIVIWATPMLGFLGTVLGISQALGGIQVGPDNDFQQMLGSLRGSLFVAFDTTALALTLSIVLMFFQFFIDRFEIQLLESVDRRAHEELSRLVRGNLFVDPGSRAVEQIGKTVLASCHDLIRQQTGIWESSMRRAESAWSETADQVSETVRERFSQSLQAAAAELSKVITANIENADQSMAGRWEQWQVTLSENARQMNQQQVNLLAQTELLKQLVEQVGTVGGAQVLRGPAVDSIQSPDSPVLPYALARPNDAAKKSNRSVRESLDQLAFALTELKRQVPSANGIKTRESNDKSVGSSTAGRIIRFRDAVENLRRPDSTPDYDLHVKRDAA